LKPVTIIVKITIFAKNQDRRKLLKIF